ncbi:MAG: nicotinate-nucleotide adenylyltransferase [Syntrophales bacterium]|jgi:nicotinate-nucleotide adenylyltransferase|nr:nicotinate-nucleotide adenylyltransferase [Syntrophales bacterium]MCK9528408.1 nicotinate-nucleotide adenylyltransferase [Syntrophales bacterium]MDX9922431.1 nicotinate-nucleotide adenylyltransferase [Syntrophales bacterium]
MKVGLFGGSFDPIHLGHLRCAEELVELLDLDKMIFIPAARQPLKEERSLLSFHHRAAMVRIAIAGNPSFALSEREYRREGPSYSIDTVREFVREYPDGTEFCFIMGQDAFQDITCWKDWRDLLQCYSIIVMTRPGSEEKTLRDVLPADDRADFSYDAADECYRGNRGGAVCFRRLTLLDISSTDIRRRCAARRSIRYLLPDGVMSYIESGGLYR